ncbi:MAG: hypothetical protein BMS9Abin05_2133 [Rhodothermia bacterium]|nr:MAG: hypothetical protein BMS9Abin05_2133 [Rhodothermia bacterium]
MIVRRTKLYNAQAEGLGLSDDEKTEIANKFKASLNTVLSWLAMFELSACHYQGAVHAPGPGYFMHTSRA